jgi:hypothetical protein
MLNYTTNITSLAMVLLSIWTMNIPFGYWRAKVKKFSAGWFGAVHIPIPFIFILRRAFEVNHGWINTPLLVLFFFTGQKVGVIINNRLSKKMDTGKFIFSDLWKYSKFSKK